MSRPSALLLLLGLLHGMKPSASPFDEATGIDDLGHERRPRRDLPAVGASLDATGGEVDLQLIAVGDRGTGLRAFHHRQSHVDRVAEKDPGEAGGYDNRH